MSASMHSEQSVAKEGRDTTAPTSLRSTNSIAKEDAGDPAPVTETDEDIYPHGLKLVAIVVSVMLGLFLVSLDNTIVGTAIPKITNDFKDLSQVSWYGSAYFMTFGGFQSMWGKLYKYFPLKVSFLASMGIFELGSLLCGVAQDSNTFIVGRAIAGLGASGVGAGAFTVVGFIASPEKRPVLLGFSGATYGIAAVLGPIIGGAFTSRVSWRWVRNTLLVLNIADLAAVSSRLADRRMEREALFCVEQEYSCFYVNLPVGGAAMVAVFLLFKTPDNAKPAEATLKEKFLQMDPVGTVLVIGFITSFLLAMQYGGQTKSWKSSDVIGLIVGSFVVFLAFVCWELIQGERAVIVPRLFKKRYIYVGSFYMFFFAGGYFMILYYLPIYFQSVKGTGPIGSGVRMLAMIVPLTFAAIAQGPLLAKIRLPGVFWISGGVLSAIGSGLLYMLNQTTSAGHWIGFQILVGAGTGWAFQTALSNAQVHAPPEDLSQVTAIIFFSLTTGGAFLISAADSAFNNRILTTLAKLAPEINGATALGTGAAEIRQVFNAQQIPLIVDAYVAGLKIVFALCAACFALSTIIGFTGSWKRMAPDAIKKAMVGAA